MDRVARTTTFVSRRPLSDAAVVHPYLAATAVFSAHWEGMLAFHAGAVVAGGRVFAILGDRGAGKSTLVWALDRLGCPIVCDDILVVRGSEALPGPRCIDLRRPAAEALTVGTPLGRVGRRHRWRVSWENAGTVLPAELPLGGFVTLGWTPDRAVARPLPLSDRMRNLEAALALRARPPEPRAFLRTAALPQLHFDRPQDLSGLSRDAELLLDALSAL